MSATGMRLLPGEVFAALSTDSDDGILVKSSRPATCAVCREVVTGSIELPEGDHVCCACAIIALRWMIVDRAACVGSGSGAFRASGGGRT